MEDSVAGYCCRGMEDSATIKKGLLWCAIKGNRVSAVYINGRVRTLPLPIRE